MRVLVLDLTHGGEVLALAYARRGDDVTAVDVYGTARPSLVSALEAEGIEVRRDAPAEDFDLGTAPVHCPDAHFGRARCSTRTTHHQAVGGLARFPFPVVEVTGTRGKTSTCHILARILADRGRRVLLLTSGGLRLVERDRTAVLEERVSIAPPTLLRLAEGEHGADIGVFEVSLGGTGVGAVSVVTTLAGDYPIAARTRRAFDGKVQMARLARGTFVHPYEERAVWAPHVDPSTELVSFGRGGEVEASLPRVDLREGSTLHLRYGEERAEVKLRPGYLAPSYLTAFGAAAASARALGVPLEAVAGTLERFEGTPGRGEVRAEDGRITVRERNPGVSAEAIDWNLRTLDACGCRDVGVVVDPVNAGVCEKLDLNAVRAAVRRHPAVGGLYLLPPSGWAGGGDGYQLIQDVREVPHPVLLWCTKEGYL